MENEYHGANNKKGPFAAGVLAVLAGNKQVEPKFDHLAKATLSKTVDTAEFEVTNDIVAKTTKPEDSDTVAV